MYTRYSSHAWSVSYYTNRPVTWQFLSYDSCVRECTHQMTDHRSMLGPLPKFSGLGEQFSFWEPPIYNLYWTTNFHNRQLPYLLDQTPLSISRRTSGRAEQNSRRSRTLAAANIRVALAHVNKPRDMTRMAISAIVRTSTSNHG